MDENVVDVAGQREAILDLLRDGPLAKRDVIDETGQSRSPVDRALDALAAAGLVVARDGGYETTCAGVLALEARRAYDSEARAIAEAALERRVDRILPDTLLYRVTTPHGAVTVRVWYARVSRQSSGASARSAPDSSG